MKDVLSQRVVKTLSTSAQALNSRTPRTYAAI